MTDWLLRKPLADRLMMTSNYKNTAMTKTWMAWCLALLAAAVITANPAHAGVGLAELPGQQGDGPVTVFYPAQEADQPVQRGPFALQLDWQGTPVPGNGRLEVVSHGSGGSPWVHTDLARVLVQAGFVVALPEHAGDNYKDHSTPGPESWKRRPAEVSRAVDAVAQDARLAPLLALDKVGVFGGSAGGHTALGFFPGGNGRPPASSSTARPIWRRIFRPASASPPACTATGWTASKRPWPSPSSATGLATRRCMHTPTRAWRPQWPWCRLQPTSTWAVWPPHASR